MSLYGRNTSSSVYKNASHRSGQCATPNLCNDIETNPGPPIHSILILLKQSRYHIVKVILCTLVIMLENIEYECFDS